jgi:tRNA-dihydrouridine synthase
MPETPGVAERFAVALSHARLVQEYELDPVGAAIEFRKHLGWYVKGLPNSAELRQRLHQVKDFREVEGIFSGYLASWSPDAPPPADEPDPSSLTCEVG